MQLRLLLILILVSTVGATTHAQSLLDTGLIWNVDASSNFSPNSITTRFRISGDTTIEGRIYRFVETSARADGNDFERTKYLFRAEGADRVILRADGHEGVIYNFGVSVGDTIRQFNRFFTTETCVTLVHSVGDTTLSDGIRRRTYRVIQEGGRRSELIIEGIGALNGGPLGLVGCVLDIGSTLRCVYQAETLLINLEGGDCFTSGVEEVRSAQTREVFPNPFQDFIQLDLPDLRTGTYQLYNSIGELVQRGKAHPRQRIEVSGMPAGIYLVRISYSSGASVVARLVKR